MVQYFIEKSPKTKEYTLALADETHKRYILSKYEPRKSALKELEKIDYGNKNTIWILFGFQFGYIIDHLKEVAGEDINILVIEPDEHLLEEALNLCQEDYIKKLHTYFYAGTQWNKLKQALDNLIGMANFNNYRIITNEGYLDFYKEYYKEALSIIDQRIEDKSINFITIILGNSDNIVNSIKNRYDMVKTCDMSQLRGQCQNVPAVLVLAGPSLEKNISYLKDFNGIIFVIGRTITPVYNIGVKPDFIVNIDNTGLIIKTFGEHKNFDIPLITMGQCSPDVVKGCQSPYKYFIYNSAEVSSLLNIRINPCLDLSGSVATLCLSSAEYIGCSPIIFLGQDLALAGDKRYAKGADSKITEVERRQQLLDIKKVKGYYGEEVYSDIQMLSFLRWIENFIYRHPRAHYINCTEGGAYIEGAEHIPFKEAIEKYNPTEKIKIKHTYLKDNQKVDIDKNLIEGIKSLKIIQENIHKASEYYDKLVKLYTEEKESKKRDQKALNFMRQIQQLDKEIKALPRAEGLMSMLLERIKYTIAASNDSKEPFHETKEALRLRTLRLNYETYIYLERECAHILSLLKEEVDKAEEEIKRVALNK